MELKDTIDSMISEDYKERLKAEYNQVNIRIIKLSEAILEYGDSLKDYVLLERQRKYMIGYANILSIRLARCGNKRYIDELVAIYEDNLD